MLQLMLCTRRAQVIVGVMVALLGACATPTARPATPPPPRRSPLSLTYLGVAGWVITHERTTLVIDPFLSRPPRDGDEPIVVDESAIAAHVPAQAQLVLVTHSHVDHLLDAPAVARRTGAALMGTVSTVRYGRGSGLAADRVIAVAGGEDYAFDGFSVRVIPGLHSALDHKHTFSGGEQIAADVVAPLRPSQFAEGGTLSYMIRLGGHTVLILGSANFIEREVAELKPSVAIVATGLRQEIHDFTRRLLRSWTRPDHILTNHFDDWRAPLVPTPPLSPATKADLAAFGEEVRSVQRDLGHAVPSNVVVPERFQTLIVE